MAKGADASGEQHPAVKTVAMRSAIQWHSRRDGHRALDDKMSFHGTK